MKTKCLNCGHEQETNSISKDELGWHTTCESCNNSYDVDIIDFLDLKEIRQAGWKYDDICYEEDITDRLINYYNIDLEKQQINLPKIIEELKNTIDNCDGFWDYYWEMVNSCIEEEIKNGSN